MAGTEDKCGTACSGVCGDGGSGGVGRGRGGDGGFEVVAGDAAEGEDADDGFLDEVIGAGRAGGDADGDWAMALEFIGVGRVFGLLVEVEVDDLFEGFETAGVADEERGELLFCDFDEVGGIGAVVAADDEHEVHGVVEHVEERVLAFLSGSADGVEDEEIVSGAVAGFDGGAETALDFLGFAFEHGGLVGDPDAEEVGIGVEAVADASGEACEEGVAVAEASDVLGDGVAVVEGEDDEVVAAAGVAEGARGGGAGFLVGGFAVDDGREVAFGVVADPAPDGHDIAAGGVDGGAAAFCDLLHDGGFSAEGWDDDDIVWVEGFEFVVGWPAGEEADVHFAELAIDLRVVDDFAEEEEIAAGEDLACGVGEVDGAFDAVAEAELFG